MAKVRNISGEERFVPWLNRDVAVDEVVTVPDEDVTAYTCQTATWGSEETSTKKTEGTL